MGWLPLFLNPLLLAGLAFAAAPVILHLLNKRRFVVHEWAAMDFLFKASTINRRRLRFEDLILLLARMLLIALLVLAVSRPLIQGLGAWREDQRLIVLDDSASMNLATPTGSVFEVAKESAVNQIQDAVGQGIPVDIQLGSAPATAGADADADADAAAADEPPVEGGPSSPPATDTAPDGSSPGESAELASASWELVRALRDKRPVDRRFELARILDRVAEEVESEGAAHRRSVVIVNDFRRTDWLEPGTDTLRDDLRETLEEIDGRNLSGRIGFLLVNVGRGLEGNLAVTGLELGDGHPLAGVPTRLLVEVTNFSPTARPQVQGTIEIAPAGDGPFTPTQRIALPPLAAVGAGESGTVEVEHTFDEPGTFLVRASLESTDALAADDDSFRVVQVRRGLEALLVDGSPGTERFAGEADYLLAALAPRGPLPSGVLPRRHLGRIDARSLEGVDVVFLLNRADLDNDERRLLTAFVADGGGLAYFLGDRVTQEAYADLAQPRPLEIAPIPHGTDSTDSTDSTDGTDDTGAAEVDAVTLFPAALKRQLSESERLTLAIEDLEHPAFAVFKGLEGVAMGRNLFSRYFELEPGEGTLVAARFADEARTPAIVEGPPGAGKVAIFNTSADRDWSDWPTDPTFVLVMQEWTRHLAPRRDGERNRVVGEPLRWKVKPGFRYTVVRPDGDELPVDAFLSGETTRRELSFAETTLAGFYRVRETRVPGTAGRGGPEEASEAATDYWFACRRDAAESDLEPVGETLLEALLQETGIRFAMGQNIEVDSFEREQEGDVGRWLALGAGCLLLLELFAAWWFGRR